MAEEYENVDIDLFEKFGETRSASPEAGSENEAETAPERPASPETAHERSGAERDGAYQKILSKVQGAAPSDASQIPQDAQDLHAHTDRESQIQHLLDLAMTKGIVHAVDVAQHRNDFYVLDQVHDRMLEEDFHDALVQAGVIKE